MGAPGRSPSEFLPLVLFADVHEADRKLLGLAVAARILVVLAGAGAREAWIVFDGDASLSEDTQADIRRACGDMVVRVLNSRDLAQALAPHGTRDLLFLSPRYLFTTPTLMRFLNSGDRLFVAGGRTVAIRGVLGSELRRVLEAQSKGTRHEPLDPGIAPLDDWHAAERQILRATGKSSDGPIAIWLNRPISQRITRYVLRVPGIEPSVVTAFNAVVAVAMFAIMLWGGELGLMAGAILYYTALVLDGVDGEMARATFRCSARGAALDTAVDMATNLLFILGLTINLTFSEGPFHALLGGSSFACYGLGVVLMTWLARRSRQGGSFDLLKRFYGGSSGGRARQRIVWFVTTAASRDTFCFVLPVLILSGLGSQVLWIFAICALMWVTLILATAPAILRRAHIRQA
jgi:phosphatidylglycerophosphate synthase